MIEVKNLTKRYGSTLALDDASLTFEAGKIYGLLGRNGAGKTTLLNIITGRIFADAGTVTMDGAPVLENDAALQNIYMLSEQTLYPEKMRVRDAFKWSASFYPRFSIQRAEEMAGQFKLNLKARVNALSTGYDTIFKLVIGLCSGVPYLLLDEPVLGLDANHRDLFYRLLLQRYTEEPFCAVVSTHLVEEVSSLVEDVVIIKEGRIIKNQPRETLLADGYTVTGPAGKVDEYIAGKQLLGADAIGGLKTAYLGGQRPATLPEGLELAGMDLQRLFIRLTGDDAGQ